MGGVIDATPHRGSQPQFCACPGPNEVPTLDVARSINFPLKKGELGCVMFQTVRDMPQNHQVTMRYNDSEKSTNEFFAERDIVRADVGTPKYPSLRKGQRRKLRQSARWQSVLHVLYFTCFRSGCTLKL